jgi:hypothetical protein
VAIIGIISTTALLFYFGKLAADSVCARCNPPPIGFFAYPFGFFFMLVVAGLAILVLVVGTLPKSNPKMNYES